MYSIIYVLNITYRHPNVILKTVANLLTYINVDELGYEINLFEK